MLRDAWAHSSSGHSPPTTSLALQKRAEHSADPSGPYSPVPRYSVSTQHCPRAWPHPKAFEHLQPTGGSR